MGPDRALNLFFHRRKVLRLPLKTPELAKATVIVPPGDAVIQHQFLSAQLVPTTDALYVGDLVGGPSQIRRFALDGKGGEVISIPKISTVSQLVAQEDGSLLFDDVSFT